MMWIGILETVRPIAIKFKTVYLFAKEKVCHTYTRIVAEIEEVSGKLQEI